MASSYIRVRGARALPIIGRVFLIVGLVGLALAAIFFLVERNGRHVATATGRVAATAGMRPVMEFKTADGVVIRFSNFVRSSFWQVGDSVAIAYDPSNPADAVVDGFGGRWFLSGFTAFLGGDFLFLGCLLTVIGLFARRRQAAPR